MHDGKLSRSEKLTGSPLSGARGHGQPPHAGAAAVDIVPVGIAPVLTWAAASPHGKVDMHFVRRSDHHLYLDNPEEFHMRVEEALA